MDGTRSLLSGSDLMLYGPVDSSGYDGFRAMDVVDSLKALTTPTINVRINSPGGSVVDGLAIYDALRADGRRVNVRVDGMAASIASVIMLAGDEIVMAENASVMIHDPWAVAAGTADQFRALADEIDRMREQIVSIYLKRTGQPRAELDKMMSAETTFGAQDAVRMGFASAIDAPLAIAACSPLDRSLLARLLMGVQIPTPEASSPVPAAIAASSSSITDEVPMATKPNDGVAVADAAVAPAVDTAQIRAEAAAAERTRVREIYALADKVRVGRDVADALVADGASIEDARMKIVDAWAANPAAGPETRPAVRVTRDAGEVRAAAITDALSVRLGSGSAPTDAAREWMDAGIADMAAELTGHRGRLNTFAARETVIMNAFAPHSTSDFANIYLNALNKTLQARYEQAAPVYRQIARQRTYNDFRPHYTVRAGDFPTLLQVGEGGEIKNGTFSDNKESTFALPYARMLPFSRQMLVNDDLSAIAQVLSSTGDAVALFEETTFFTNCMASNGPTLGETGRAMFNTTDKTKAASGTAIDVANVAAGRAAMRKQTSKDGNKINVAPSILLVGPDKELEAQQLYAAINAQQPGYVNPFSGSLQVITTPQITGNAWYLFASPAMVPNFEYGLLSGYTAPRLRMDEPFGYQGMSVSLEHDFGCGAIDFRGGYLNAGN